MPTLPDRGVVTTERQVRHPPQYRPEAPVPSAASLQRAARTAGAAYLVTTAIVAVALYGVYGGLVVAGDAAQTARNIVAHEGRFRVVIACYLTYSAGVVVLLTALYTIFKPVDRNLALLGALWRLMYAATWLFTTMNLLGVLRTLGGAEYLQVFQADQLQAMARFSLGGGFDAYYLGLPFYGLASTVSSYLWWRSNYIPRPLAAWGLLSSVLCVVCAFAFIAFPDFDKTVNPYWFDAPMGGFEIATSVWLLFRGVRLSAPAGSDETGDRAAD